MKNDSTIRIRLPENIKDVFKEYCDKELIDMSVKIRQMILKELKENKIKC